MARKKTSTTKADAEDKTISDAVDAQDAAGEDSIVSDAEDVTDRDASDVVVEDAIVVDTGDLPDEDALTDAQTAEDAIEDVQDDPSLAILEMADDRLDDDPAQEWDTPADDAVETTEETAPEQISDYEPVREIVKPDPAPAQASGFFPMLLGGLVAGGIGFGAAYLGLQNSNVDTSADLRSEIAAQLETQAESIAAVSGQIDNLPPPADLSGLEAAQDDLNDAIANLGSRLGEAESRFGDLDARLTNVEKRPVTENASDAAVAAYERELKALQDAMAAQRGEIESMTAEAQALDQNARQTAQATMRRSALTRIQTALDSGEGFAPALADLETAGLQAPEALVSVAEEGAPSLAQLQTEFPEAARMALKVSRLAAVEQGEGGGFSTFLKTQLGARSLEPREGDDPDAVLSRAEAAVRDGRLTDAMAEIEALPEVGGAEFSDWAAKATMRLNALAAAEDLGKELN